MNITTCDICGERLPDLQKLEEKKRKLTFMQNPYGYFTFAHFRARVNDEGKVTGHEWGCPTDALCPECADRIDAAIREAIIKIAADAPAARTYRVKAPYLNMEPIPTVLEEDACG